MAGVGCCGGLAGLVAASGDSGHPSRFLTRSSELSVRTAYITHPACFQHEMIAEHPECPGRLSAIEDRLISAGLFDFLAHYQAPEATTRQLARVHERSYIRDLLKKSQCKAN